MDYSYYTGNAQSFFPLQPPTPTYTNASNSDEFSNSPPQDALEHFQPYDYANQYNPRIPQTTTQHKPSIAQPMYSEMPTDVIDDVMRRGSNSDDEENLTPAQSRRKAQNRQAQRAFRERKERHVKELEAKLAELEKNTGDLTQENERLKLKLAKAATENEILKATSGHSSRGGSEPLANTGPMEYTPTDFYTEVLYAHENKVPSHRIVLGDKGERLLAAGATWDYITNHPLYKRGLVDVGIISERLKGVAKCDGQGPVFEESVIIDAIEKSVAAGNDELL
ncbi:56b2e669-bef9-4085-ae2a-da19de16e4cb [Sclerotinia trifoliorum]|uniref:56b2e669-bef9-4085-ae2a-da19de16e4cb n=1 Tax=Sclerotinia trifoliorum TaxID=28548 RepID=A0A8H2VWF9_9HELO|nr:56b2e669-bef9-4085-ae2a-da19de16e4cb [Sclerotinia trifoliorum]